MPAHDSANASTVPRDETVRAPVTRLGRYTLRERIGVGGMAEVYLGEQDGPQQFKKRVVVKRILPSLAAEPGFVALFVREAQVAARLSHANVVQIFELGEERREDLPGQPPTTEYFIAMEYIEGLTLQRLAEAAWRAGRDLPLDVVLRTLADAARGLHAAHTLAGDDGRPLDLVHRDISPDNLMVARDGVTRVLDFGIAKGNLDAPTTRAGSVRGKVPYLAPEQVTGKPLDARCDLWALGVCACWLLTGKRPFDRDTDFHTMGAIMEAAAPPPSSINSSVPPALDALVLRLLEKDAARRPASAAEVADALEELTGPGTGSGRRTTMMFVEEFLKDHPLAANPVSDAVPIRTALHVDPDGATRIGARPHHTATPKDERAQTWPGVVHFPLADGAVAPRAAPASADTPSTPAPASTPSSAHPVVSALTRPRERHGLAAVALVLVGLVILAGAALAGWSLLIRAPPLAASPSPPPDPTSASTTSTTPTMPPEPTAPVVNTPPQQTPGITAPPAASAPSSHSAALVSEPATSTPSRAASTPAGPPSPPPSAGPRGARLEVQLRGPPRIRWALEGGADVGTGSTRVTLPPETTHVIARDPARGQRHVLTLDASHIVDYGTLPAGTLHVTQSEGRRVYLDRDLIDDTAPVRVVSGTYIVRVKQGTRELSARSVEIAPGQRVEIDAGAPLSTNALPAH